MGRVLRLSVVMLLLLAACGGSGGDGSDEAASNDSDDQPTTTQPAVSEEDSGQTRAPTTTTSPSDGGEGSSPDASSGMVTVAGETYDFADTGFPGLQCEPSSFNVAFLAALRFVDENGGELDGSLSLGVPFKGEEETAGIMPEVSASVGDLKWIASPDHAELNNIPAGSSQVDSYEIDGNSISGTATFYEEDSSFGGGELIVEQGTFEVTCVES